MGIGNRAAPAQSVASPFDVRFRLMRHGSSIGRHAVTFRQDGATTIARVDVTILVRILFINAFRFRHSSEEIFASGRLTMLRSTTNDNGLVYGVSGAVTRAGFRMEGTGGPFVAPATLMTTNSIWDPEFVRQRTLIDAQHGGLVGLVTSRIGTEAVTVRGTRVEALKYRVVMPYCAGHLWYSLDGRWVGGALEMRGETIEYVLE